MLLLETLYTQGVYEEAHIILQDLFINDFLDFFASRIEKINDLYRLKPE